MGLIPFFNIYIFMINLNFIADRNLLAVHTIRNSSKDRFLHKNDTVVDFQNEAWNFDKEAYNLLRYGPSEMSFVNNSLEGYVQKVKNFQEKIVLFKEFEKLTAETLQAKKQVMTEWNNNLEKSNAKISLHDLNSRVLNPSGPPLPAIARRATAGFARFNSR
ncbi:MAG: hypothetical protein WC878_02595 [Candidatus Paceibacterota bacterium]